jgi:hypothetical protein
MAHTMNTTQRSLALVLLTSLAACAGAPGDDLAESDDAMSLQSFMNLVTNKVDRSRPDPHNKWAKKKLARNEENFLPGEDQMFAAMAQKVLTMQNMHKEGAIKNRAFHAKSHGCVRGEVEIDPAALPAGARFGVFSRAATYPAWARFSNGVGFHQSDKKVDVRGLAIKLTKVQGEQIDGGDATTQDFLLTNGAITPAPDAEHFVEFGMALSKANDPNVNILGRIQNLVGAGGFLLREENIRILDFLIHRTVPNVRSKGTVLGDQFWTGGAIALGIERTGDVMRARAKNAIKMTAVPGVLSGNACVPVQAPPRTGQPGYLRDDLQAHLARGPICADLKVQFQQDPDAQPIEDTSVEWTTPWITVGRLVVEKIDLDSANAKADEATCEGLAFTPWHTLADHRPLGNIQRARRAAYDVSAKGRAAKPEPKD